MVIAIGLPLYLINPVTMLWAGIFFVKSRRRHLAESSYFLFSMTSVTISHSLVIYRQLFDSLG